MTTAFNYLNDKNNKNNVKILICVINLAMRHVLSYNISSIDILNRYGMIISFIRYLLSTCMAGTGTGTRKTITNKPILSLWGAFILIKETNNKHINDEIHGMSDCNEQCGEH